MEYNNDILETLSSLSNHEVFTPPWVAEEMLDLLPEEVWTKPEYKFLDPFVKTGVFLRGILYRLDKNLPRNIYEDKETGYIYNLDDEQDRIDHIFKNMIYGISISELTGYISRRTLYGVMKANSNRVGNTVFNSSLFKDEKELKLQEEGNIFFLNPLHTFDKKGTCEICGYKEKNINKNLEEHAYAFIHNQIHMKIKEIKQMKFNVIIGNPPYQVSDGTGGGGSSAKPIYNKFIEMAIDMNPEYLTMIIPSRWMTDGKGLDKFRKKMLNDKRFSYIVDFKNENDCFPSIELPGGVNYFLWEKNHNGLCKYRNNYEKSYSRISLNKYDILIRNQKALPILAKIYVEDSNYLNQKVSVSKPFGLRSNFKNYEEKYFENSIKYYANNIIGYLEKNKILVNKNIIEKYKVIVSKANGAALKNKTIITAPFIIEPDSVCSETYLVIDSFENQTESENMIKYIKTKFFRFLVSLRKNTQNTTRDTYSFVPVLPMTEEWTDEKLYKKYNLTQKEISYIEESISQME